LISDLEEKGESVHTPKYHRFVAMPLHLPSAHSVLVFLAFLLGFLGPDFIDGPFVKCPAHSHPP
jgi:hypothetical protein